MLLTIEYSREKKTKQEERQTGGPMDEWKERLDKTTIGFFSPSSLPPTREPSHMHVHVYARKPDEYTHSYTKTLVTKKQADRQTK